MRYRSVSFLSDYGTGSESVGTVKSVLQDAVPEVAVVDITHEIEPYDVRSGSLSLVRVGASLAPGVVLAIVDGRSARPVAVEVGGGESVLLGPDNGLLAPLAASVGGATKVVVIEYPTGPVSMGRDIYAPATAALCAGADVESLGVVIDAAELRPAMLAFSALKDGQLEADVVSIDRFGNAQLNVTPGQLEGLVGPFELELNQRKFRATLGDTLPQAGQTALVVDPQGLLTLMMEHASAADRHGLSEQDSLTIRPVGDA